MNATTRSGASVHGRSGARRLRPAAAALVVLTALVLASPLAGSLSGAGATGRPEDVGLSSARLQRVNDLVKRHLDARTFAGAVTLVARHGTIVHLQAHGLMDLEAKKAMSTDGLFRIMSMTKPVVGVAILMLMEEGKVRLTDPASKFIPELKGLKVAVEQPRQGPPPAPGAAPEFYTVPAAHDITVRELLTHTSGLVSGPMSSGANRAVALKGTESLADYLPRLAQTPLEFQPGTRWGYSAQAGFDVLLRIVEIASGQPADRFLKARLFDPLGMKDTFFYPAEGNPRMVTRYQRTPAGVLDRQTNPGFMNGAYFSGGGGLFSTAEDYFRFAQMLLDGGELEGQRILGERTVALMRSVYAPDTLPGRPAGEGYGLSVRVVRDAVARNTFLSNGSFGWSGAYGTHFWIDPQEKIVGVLMSQTPNQEIRIDFENTVMSSIVGSGLRAGTGTH